MIIERHDEAIHIALGGNRVMTVMVDQKTARDIAAFLIELADEIDRPVPLGHYT